VVIGASAGGVETLRRVAADLRPNLPAAVCVVLHIAPQSPSALAAILDRAGPLPCRPASDGEPLKAGEILVAPPDRHLVISDDHAGLTLEPRENGHRPAVDVLFRSAAHAQARARPVVGVILSGMRDDGTAGLAVIKAHGGAAIVQDPEEALYSGMPANALAHVRVDAVVPSSQIADTIAQMVSENAPVPAAPLDNPGHSVLAGEPVISVCPECGGVLSELRAAGLTQWTCRVGHRYSPESLADAQAEGVEAALWAAVRALEDREGLLERVAAQLESRGQPRSGRSFRRRAVEASNQARSVREALGRAAAVSLRRIADGDDGDREEEEMAYGER
jgi:two-component system, chemotaxis family, protein-glutamate methylesterase/glutaminase